ncbi:hypothetical protein BGW38_001532, partial [Lunasporangiospora selenospora]
VTEEGLKIVAALSQNKDFGAAASALLKKHSAESTDLEDESSCLSCPFGPSSPNLISSVSKRLNLPPKVLSSRYEEGVLRLDIDLKSIDRAFS